MLKNKNKSVPSGRLHWQGKSICPLWIPGVKHNTKKKRRKKKKVLFIFKCLSVVLSIRVTFTQHWLYPASGQSPTGLRFSHFQRRLHAFATVFDYKCMPPSYSLCRRSAPLFNCITVAFMAHVESIKCAYAFFFPKKKKYSCILYGGNHTRLYSVAECLWC